MTAMENTHSFEDHDSKPEIDANLGPREMNLRKKYTCSDVGSCGHSKLNTGRWPKGVSEEVIRSAAAMTTGAVSAMAVLCCSMASE